MNEASLTRVKLPVFELLLGKPERLRQVALADPTMEDFERLQFTAIDFLALDELNEDSYYSIRPRFSVPSTATPAAITYCLWKFTRELYINPARDKADLSAWLDAGMPTLVQRKSLAGIYKESKNPETLTVSNEGKILGVCHFS